MDKWLAAAIGTAKIDPFELWPVMSHESLKATLAIATTGYSRNPERSRLWERIVTFAFWSIWNSVSLLFSRGRSAPNQKTDILFFASSRNNYDALQPIYEQMKGKNRCLIVAKEEIEKIRRLSHLTAVPYLPFMLVQALAKKGYCRESIRWGFDVYWQNYGLYFLMRLWLERLSPKVLFVANDHVNMPCILTKAAADLGIATCYVQHASVTKNFPPLRFDYAFLDGLDAAKKYAAAESRKPQGVSRVKKCNVYLVGLSKFENLLTQANESERVQRIGVCASPVDDLQKIEELLLHIKRVYPGLKMIFRPHLAITGNSKARLRSFSLKNSIAWSDGNEEAPVEFLSRVDAIVSGSSGILLEAALMNVTPLNYSTNEDVSDYYGFAANGLCSMTSDLDELSGWIGELIAFRPPAKMKAKQYCETINTPFEGMSARLIASVVASIDDGLIAEGCEVSWEAVCVSRGSEAFQPRLPIKPSRGESCLC